MLAAPVAAETEWRDKKWHMIMAAILIKFKCNINVWVETFAMRFYKVRLAVKAQGI
ncbi:MAG: hypothetical protein ACI8R0_003348, partial [Alteromonadales bacterium]